MGCTDFVVKYLLFVVNILVIITAFICIAIGSLAAYNLRKIHHIVGFDRELLIAITLIVIGCVIFIIAFFGCCGAIAENPLLLSVYAVIMLILSAVKTHAIVQISRLISGLEEDAFSYIITKPELLRLYHILEAAFGCCGTTGPQSYESLLTKLPPSCCPGLHIPIINDLGDLGVIQDILDIASENNFSCTHEEANSGCNPVFYFYLQVARRIVVNSCLIMLSSEIIATVFALYLAQHFRNEKENKEIPNPLRAISRIHKENKETYNSSSTRL